MANAANLARLESGEIDASRLLAAPTGDDLWELILLAGSLDARVDAAIGVAGTGALSSRATRSNWRRRSMRSITSTTFFRRKTREKPRVFAAAYGAGARAVGPPLLGVAGELRRRKKCEPVVES